MAEGGTSSPKQSERTPWLPAMAMCIKQYLCADDDTAHPGSHESYPDDPEAFAHHG